VHGERLGSIFERLWRMAGLMQRDTGPGTRSWYAVRKQLLRAASMTDTLPFGCLYVPERFHVHERELIHARRRDFWNSADPSTPLLLIGELKGLRPARTGFQFVIRHLPDTPFGVDETLYGSFSRRFESELAWWSQHSDSKLVLMGTFTADRGDSPVMVEAHATLVDWQWVPVLPNVQGPSSRDPEFVSQSVGPRRQSGQAAMAPLAGR
jgi:hypothetical protein